MSNTKKIWIYGRHAANAALTNKNRKISKILVTSEVYKQTEQLLNGYKSLLHFTTNKELNTLFKGATHQGIALEVATIFLQDLAGISNILQSKRSLIVILDQLTDPQNVGSIIRSAHAFCADAIFTSKNNSFSETPALAKAACGALDLVPVVLVTNLASTIKTLKDEGYWVVGLDSGAKQYLRDFEFTSKIAIVLGAEGSGLRELTRKNCDFLLKISMNKAAESINASNACAIAMHSYFESQLL